MARKPEKVFRIGFVTASVFANEVDAGDGKRVMRSVNLQRRYLDGDEAKYVASFSLAEIPQAIRALTLAQRYVETKEAEVNGD